MNTADLSVLVNSIYNVRKLKLLRRADMKLHYKQVNEHTFGARSFRLTYVKKNNISYV